MLPGLAGYPTLSDLAIGQEQASQTLEILLTGMESGAYDSAPDALKDINAREIEALTAASNAPYPSKEFFTAYAQYYDVEIECAKLGHTESTPSLYARSELIHRLAGLENPEVYASATEMPTTYYLAFVVGLMPGIILLLPVALLTSGSQRRLGGRTLVSMAPVSRASERLACTAVASVLSLACLAAALLPAALLAATKNGIGDFAYPVVSITDGAVSSSTIGDVLAQDAALMALASLMVVALVTVAESIRKVERRWQGYVRLESICYPSPSSSRCHSVQTASLGMRRSPRGLTATVPTLGPSGRQLRLNCCEKKRP